MGSKTLEDIQTEQDRQVDLWGVQTHHPLKWLAILMEEVGEVANAILEDHDHDLDHLSEEVIQVAAVAASWADDIEGRVRVSQKYGTMTREDRFLRAVGQVQAAWNVAGPHPETHERAKRQLRHEWPSLAAAVEHLAKP